MPVGSDRKIVLSFNLLNADPADWIYDWDFQSIDETLLASMIEALGPIVNISVESQVLYHTPTSALSYWDEKLESYIFSTKELPFFVNSNEWHLDTSIAAGGRSKILHLVYVPASYECPLHLQLPNGEISHTNGFISPMWGGLIVLNTPSCSEDPVGKQPARLMIFPEDLQKVFEIFMRQFRQLFGLKSNNIYAGSSGTFNLLTSEKGFTECGGRAWYDNGIFAPGRCSKAYGNCTEGNSGTEPYIVAHNLILAHAAAVQRYRQKYLETQKGRIGILNVPLTKSKADNYAAQRARDFHIGWFLHPIVYGEYPRTMQDILLDRLPTFTEQEVKMVKGSFDFIGINQYTSYYMYDPHQEQSKDLSYQQDWNVGFAYVKNGVPIGEKAYSDLALQSANRDVQCTDVRAYSDIIIIREWHQGMHQGLYDTGRIDYYYKSYLKAVDDEANVIAWSLVDNFEWRSG